MLAKAMKTTASISREQVAQNKVLNAISKSSQSNIEELATHLQTQKLPLADARDITHEVVAPRLKFGPDVAEGSISVYKGILKGLAEISPRRFSILAGSNETVFDAILADSTQQVLENLHVQARWKERGYIPLGLAVLNARVNMGNQSSEAFLDDLLTLDLYDSELLLVVFRGASQPECYQLEKACNSGCGSSADGKRKPTPVCLKALSENKKKGCQYCVVPVEKVGVSLQDEATSLVHAAIRQHVAEALENTHSSRSGTASEQVPKAQMLVKSVPADGMCFFHCVTSSINFESYSKVPRRKGGYATNVRQVALEEKNAHRLMQSVLEKVDYSCEKDAACAAQLVAGKGVIDLELIPFITRMLGLGIRCTIADEEGVE